MIPGESRRFHLGHLGNVREICDTHAFVALLHRLLQESRHLVFGWSNPIVVRFRLLQPHSSVPDDRTPYIAFTISSTIFFASANSIIVLSLKNSSFSIPAYPDPIPRFENSTVFAFSTSSTGMP